MNIYESGTSNLRVIGFAADYLLIRKSTPSDWPAIFMQFGSLGTTTYVLPHVSHLSPVE